MNTKLHMLTLALLATLAGSAFAQSAPPPAAGALPDPTQMPPVPSVPPTTSEDAIVPPTANAPVPPAPPSAPAPPPSADAPPPPAVPMPPTPPNNPPATPMPPMPMGSDTGATTGTSMGTDTTTGASGQAQVTSHPGNSISSNYHVDFDAMDANHDGSISRAEAKGNPDLTREFRVVDSNHNGRLSKDEMKGWLD